MKTLNDIYNIAQSAYVFDQENGNTNFENSILTLPYKKNETLNKYYNTIEIILKINKSDIDYNYKMCLIEHFLTENKPNIEYCACKPIEMSDLFQTLIKLDNDNNIDINKSIEILENNLLNIELNNNFKRDAICYILDVKNNKIPISRTLFKQLIKFFYNKKLNNINEFGYNETY